MISPVLMSPYALLPVFLFLQALNFIRNLPVFPSGMSPMTISRNCTWLFDGLPLMSMVKAGVQPKQRLVSLLKMLPTSRLPA